MLKAIQKATPAILFALISGCSSLGVMDKAKYVETPANNKGLINIVRPYIFMGDGVKFEVWDGSKFIGTLSSGGMIQYNAEAGNHCIMIDPTQGGEWATFKLEVKPNKSYFLKPNTIPFVGIKIGLAEESDPRKNEWSTKLKAYSLNESKTKRVPEKIINKAKQYSEKCI